MMNKLCHLTTVAFLWANMTALIFAQEDGGLNSIPTGPASLTKLAADHFYEGDVNELTAAEQMLVDHTEKGEVTDLSQLKEGEDPELHATRIIWLSTDRVASRAVTHRGIRILNGRIDGILDLTSAEIPFPLAFERCTFGDEILLESAHVRELNLDGSRTGPINADGLRVDYDLFMKDVTVDGTVRLLGARIDGNLECDGGHFTAGKDGKAIFADNIEVKGSIFLRNGFSAKGEIRLLDATIGKQLSCLGGSFFHPIGSRKALSGHRLTVHGSLKLGSNEKYQSEVQGEINLTGAQIDKTLEIRAIDEKSSTTIVLRLAKVGTLNDRPTKWPKKTQLKLHGLVYDEISYDAPRDAKTRIQHWLARNLDSKSSMQPYEHLARVLKKGGQREEADQILIEMAKQRARSDSLNWSGKIWYRYIGPIIGFGYQPWWVLASATYFIFFGTAVFQFGKHMGIVVPAKHAEQILADGQSSGATAENYPCFNAFWFSIDTFAPIIDLKQMEYWLPVCRTATWTLGGKELPVLFWFIRLYFWVQIIFGWCHTTILVVALAGLLPD